MNVTSLRLGKTAKLTFPHFIGIFIPFFSLNFYISRVIKRLILLRSRNCYEISQFCRWNIFRHFWNVKILSLRRFLPSNLRKYCFFFDIFWASIICNIAFMIPFLTNVKTSASVNWINSSKFAQQSETWDDDSMNVALLKALLWSLWFIFGILMNSKKVLHNFEKFLTRKPTIRRKWVFEHLMKVSNCVEVLSEFLLQCVSAEKRSLAFIVLMLT